MLRRNAGFADSNASASFYLVWTSVPGCTSYLFWPLCVVTHYPGLPDMKHSGTQTQRAAAMKGSRRTGSTEILHNWTWPKKLKMTRALLKHGFILELPLKDGDSLKPWKISRWILHELEYKMQIHVALASSCAHEQSESSAWHELWVWGEAAGDNSLQYCDLNAAPISNARWQCYISYLLKY